MLSGSHTLPSRGGRDQAGGPWGPGSQGGAGATGGSTLALPSALPASAGCDAVAVPASYGFRILARLPRSGCVFADADRWWWVVPPGSDHDLTWPHPARYAPGARAPQIPGRRLIHCPGGTSPYTPPIPLYLVVCQLTGTAPAWS
ncbi:hypothetical protein ACFVYD_02615 [Streptomyces sp. NPDC058301]|uniref:hypothetical protein n=1 Tax=Streptomyces sp. NPDC058301 TaxID=3346436 RepID=UPI0036E38D8C